MFLTSYLLLIPMIFATEIKYKISNYVIKIEDHYGRHLKGIEFTTRPSKKLNLSGLNLNGIMRNAFKNVNHLKILNLSNNSFNALSVNELVNLTNLEQLYLSNNELGRIDDLFVGLSNLKIVDVSNTNVLTINLSGRFASTKSCLILLGAGIRPIKVDPYWNALDQWHEIDTYDSGIPIKICIDDGKLISVEHYTEGEELASGCNTNRTYANGVLALDVLGIVEFQKDWYKLGDSSIHHIHLKSNRITRLTSEMLNDLPESISIVDLRSNKIERLEKGIIVNKHLREIDFSFNRIIEIEDEVFINTNLTVLALAYNPLTNTKFAATLPPTLARINLINCRIAEISRESFSNLNKLEVLSLDYNVITEIYRDSLRGLSGLKNLTLEYGILEKIEAGSFKGLTALEVLRLNKNRIIELEASVFADLTNIKCIFLDSNQLTTFFITDPSLDLPDSLKVLDLQNNTYVKLGASIFLNSPKYKFIIKNN